jgi:chromosome segregation protein
VFLKSLTLKGFKSFADATTMQLEPGVTVVVGPNGSGKSNVVDAIAWVLGAQAPSAVRSQKMDDVIFAGTAKRPALGRAEVSLTIDNSAGLLGIEFSEVTVSRTLFRTGESEYAINGVACRLLDVQELLSDAGVGRQQHVIVSQGQIDAVLNARPEDRRSIIEEAAGVLKFRKRKEKAERRLDATEANLLRVQDLLREVRRQLRPLERQAEAARRHGDLVAELAALRVFLAGREIASQRARLAALATARLDSERAERELKAELATLDTNVVAAEAELSAHGADDIGDQLVRVEHLRERARGIAAVIVERRRAMERDRGQLLDQGVVANLEHDAARLREELAAVIVELGAFEPEAAAIAADEERLRLDREGAELDRPVVDAASRAASAAAEVRGELRTLRNGVERDEGELRRATARRGQLDDRIAALDADIERLRAECHGAEQVETPLVAEVERAESDRLAAEAVAESTTARRHAAAQQASHWTARAEALQQALDAVRARAGAERLSGVAGVLGTLLELVEIVPGWEAAVEAALGEALTAVVVENPDAARHALATLQSSDTTGAVLALGGAIGPMALTPSIGSPVRPMVRSPRSDVEALLDALLAGAVRVDDVGAAVDAALASPGASVVTGSGDRFGRSGWRVGAAAGGATAVALDDASLCAEQASAELAALNADLDTARQALAAATQREREVARRLDANDARFTAASEGLGRAQGERREAHAEAEASALTIGELTEHLSVQRVRIAELEALIPALEADEAAETEAARARGEARASLEARAAVLASRRKDLEVRNAGLLERQQFLERRIDETERRLAADAEARAHAEQRRLAVERSMAAIDRLAGVVDAHRHAVESLHADLAERRRRQSDEVRELTGRLDRLRRARHDAERLLEESRERSRRAEIDEAETKLRLETAVESLRRDLDYEPAAAEATEQPPLPEGTTAAARVRDLERELRLLGPINPLALEEFNELQERHRFLEEQLDDVRNTRRELMRVIKAIDVEIQNVFASAYADVSTNFAALFEMLFPGGTGKLVLTNPDDLLNTGIEVEAKPSGKNVKKLSLLSGGERSLTALAFLFAVFRSRPSPFYVMDEVEAALDDVNLHRFLSLVAEFRREAQLLIVSHQKRTMEAGDCLLGVTMQPGGSSKVVTEKVSTSA